LSSTLIVPSSVNTATGWSNKDNALTQNNVCASLAAGSGASAWLPIRLSTAALDISDDVVGFVLEAWVGVVTTLPAPMKSPETECRLEFALSTDGSTPLGTPKTVDVYQLVGLETLGTSVDLWGTTITAAQVNAGLYVLVRRPSLVDEDTGIVRLVDYVRLTAHHTPSGGSLMAERFTSLQRALIGKETTRGTAVAATQRLMAVTVTPDPQGDVKAHVPQGEKLASDHFLTKEWGAASIEGVPCYRELGVLLASVLQKPVVRTVDTGVYEHEFRFASRDQADFQTYTLEFGEKASRAEEYPYAYVNDLELNFNRSGGDMSVRGQMLMQRIDDGTTMTPGSNEQQTITLSSGSSTFVLKFKGKTTSALANNVSAAAMQSALEGLSTIGSGNVAVSGSGPWVVTFQGDLAGQNLPYIEVVSTTNTMSVAETTRGGLLEMLRQAILPGQVSVYVSEDYATLASGKLTRAFVTNWAARGMRNPFWVLNDSSASFEGHSDATSSIGAALTLEADSNGMAMLTRLRNNTTVFVRIKATGPTISGANKFGLEIDMACKVSALPGLTDVDGIVCREWNLESCFDPVQGFSTVVRLQNDVSAY
jgi:hypothetical protein